MVYDSVRPLGMCWVNIVYVCSCFFIWIACRLCFWFCLFDVFVCDVLFGPCFVTIEFLLECMAVCVHCCFHCFFFVYVWSNFLKYCFLALVLMVVVVVMEWLLVVLLLICAGTIFFSLGFQIVLLFDVLLGL